MTSACSGVCGRSGRVTAWKLYWVTDDRTGGMEDCFIIAQSEGDAEFFHEDSEGLGEGDAVAEYISDVPAPCEAEAIRQHQAWLRENGIEEHDEPHPWPAWAPDAALVAVGAEIRQHSDTIREIIIAGRSFFPSTIEDVLAEREKNPSTH